jgi:hypothetical protein
MGAAPQEVINKQIVDQCDFGIAIFWARMGSPTEKHPSGSAEEIERLLAKGANVLVYFSDKAVPHSMLKDDQYDRLQELRKDYQKRGLLATFPSADKLAEMVSLHLTSLVSAMLTKERASNQPIPSVGNMTAPVPDIRIRVAAAHVGHAPDMVPRLVVEIQNHSPIDFFFASLNLSLASGTKAFITRDAVHGLPVMPEKIQPGNGKSIVLDIEQIQSELSNDGDSIVNAFVVDKIDRRYVADEKDMQRALDQLKEMGREHRQARRR